MPLRGISLQSYVSLVLCFLNFNMSSHRKKLLKDSQRRRSRPSPTSHAETRLSVTESSFRGLSLTTRANSPNFPVLSVSLEEPATLKPSVSQEYSPLACLPPFADSEDFVSAHVHRDPNGDHSYSPGLEEESGPNFDVLKSSSPPFQNFELSQDRVGQKPEFSYSNDLSQPDMRY